MYKTQTLFLALFIITLFSCSDKNTNTPCNPQTIAGNKTVLSICEYLGDSSYPIKNTAIANELLKFSFTYPYPAKVISTNWDIDNANFTSTKDSFNLRFTNAGEIPVTLHVTYQPLTYCGTPGNFTDTLHVILHILPEGHSSILEGKYSGTLDSASSAPFTISINYYKWPGDDIGGYYLYNYVPGCTGDGINPNIPKHTGYEIIAGYSNFNIQSYPCAAPNTFKGFGYLNTTGDCITIQHFGYGSAYTNDTNPRWHVFKGKRM